MLLPSDVNTSLTAEGSIDFRAYAVTTLTMYTITGRDVVRPWTGRLYVISTLCYVSVHTDIYFFVILQTELKENKYETNCLEFIIFPNERTNFDSRACQNQSHRRWWLWHVQSNSR